MKNLFRKLLLILILTELILIFFFYFVDTSIVLKPTYWVDIYTDNRNNIVDNVNMKNCFFHVRNSNKIDYTYNLDNNGLRPTRNKQINKNFDTLNKVFILGCSFTFGDGVNDTQSCAYLIQDKLQNYDVINLSKGGYGNSLAYFRLSEYLKKHKNKTKFVILNYASFHNVREIDNLYWKQFTRIKKHTANLHIGNKVDTATLNERVYYYTKLINDSLEIIKEYEAIKPLPFYNNIKTYYYLHQLYVKYDLYRKQDLMLKTTQALIKQMDVICNKHNAIFVLNTITNDPLTDNMIEFCKLNNINVERLDINFQNDDLHLPNDGHPSIRGHHLMAEKMLLTMQKYEIK